jgi:hypothetical protein
MSVLIQDLDFYQVPIEDFIYQWNRGREVGVYNSYYFFLEENFDVMFAKRKTTRYIELYVNLSGWYEKSEIDPVFWHHDDNDDEPYWDTDFKSIMFDKMVSDLGVREFK